MNTMKNYLYSLIFVFFLVSPIVAQADSVALNEATLDFNLPDHWHNEGRDQTVSDKIVYIFKRDYIVNKSGIKIIPAILVINENNVTDDSVLYFVNKQIQFNLKNIVKFYTFSDDATVMKQAIILHSSNYNSKAQVSFDSVVMTATYGNHGLTVFCNVTTDTYDDVKDEFYKALKTMKIETTLPQDEIIETTREDKGKRFVEMMSNKDTFSNSDKKVSIIKTVLTNVP